MRRCEKTSSARSRAGWLRNSGAPSSAPSTTKRTWPECVASPALIARLAAVLVSLLVLALLIGLLRVLGLVGHGGSFHVVSD